MSSVEENIFLRIAYRHGASNVNMNRSSRLIQRRCLASGNNTIATGQLPVFSGALRATSDH